MQIVQCCWSVAFDGSILDFYSSEIVIHCILTIIIASIVCSLILDKALLTVSWLMLREFKSTATLSLVDCCLWTDKLRLYHLASRDMHEISSCGWSWSFVRTNLWHWLLLSLWARNDILVSALITMWDWALSLDCWRAALFDVLGHDIVNRRRPIHQLSGFTLRSDCFGIVDGSSRFLGTKFFLAVISPTKIKRLGLTACLEKMTGFTWFQFFVSGSLNYCSCSIGSLRIAKFCSKCSFNPECRYCFCYFLKFQSWIKPSIQLILISVNQLFSLCSRNLYSELYRQASFQS